MYLFTRLVCLVTLCFFIFVCWIIMQADTGSNNYFIYTVHKIPGGDKLGHMWIYGMLALMLSFLTRKNTARYFNLPLGCAIVLLFALVEEFTQGFFPTRTLDLADAGADYLGVQLAAWFMTRACKSVVS